MLTSLSAKGTEFLSFFQDLLGNDPLFRECAGAKEVDIEALLTYAERPLPALYLDYLRILGGNDGPLRLGLDGTCSAKSVLRSLKTRGEYWKDSQPPNTFCFSTGGSIANYAFLYTNNIVEPCIVLQELDRITSTVAETFEIYLFRHAWQRRWFGKQGNPSSPELTVRGVGIRSVQKIERIAQEHGFSSAWFSDCWSLCAEKGSIRLITQLSSIDTYVYFSGPDRLVAARECKAFEEALGSSDSQSL